MELVMPKVVISDRPDLFYDIKNIGNIGNSDHATIGIDLLVNCDRPENAKMVRDWQRTQESPTTGAMEPPTLTAHRT